MPPGPDARQERWRDARKFIHLAPDVAQIQSRASHQDGVGTIRQPLSNELSKGDRIQFRRKWENPVPDMRNALLISNIGLSGPNGDARQSLEGVPVDDHASEAASHLHRQCGLSGGCGTQNGDHRNPRIRGGKA